MLKGLNNTRTNPQPPDHQLDEHPTEPPRLSVLYSKGPKQFLQALLVIWILNVCICTLAANERWYPHNIFRISPQKICCGMS